YFGVEFAFCLERPVFVGFADEVNPGVVAVAERFVDYVRDAIPQFVLTCHFRTPVNAKCSVVSWLCSHSRRPSTSLIGLPCFVCGGVCVSNYVFQFGCCFPYLVLCVFVCPPVAAGVPVCGCSS